MMGRDTRCLMKVIVDEYTDEETHVASSNSGGNSRKKVMQ